MDSKSKIIVITGATSGIGMAVIREFLNVYPDCYFILVSRSREKMRERIESKADIREQIRYEIVETDLCNLHESEDSLEPRIREIGRVDILVNVAGEFISKPFVEMEAEDFYRLVMSNLFTVFVSGKTILPFMLNQRFGSIVNVGSVLGLRPMSDTKCAVYGAVKSAVAHLTRMLSAEYGEYNIRVNCVCPGILNPVEGVGEGSYEAYRKLNGLNHYLGVQPLKWFGSSSNVAKAIVFLASEQSEWTTGEVMCVDGGMGV
ncbi:SDR family NAD(P)-dependent oxidoreductase [uncultured Bacteroides sp.]|uniref:SDR family NAD(P)-dependent oxidoreductase n=1 Tax=uncultured Bacteroides sp. TaxID=162156 RepID=UPI0026744900|nr:SDR family oxidoreductase [uncultured Bacteroides sp.]